MAFEYKPFINPYIGSISELMGKGDEAKAAALIRIGEIQARAAEQQGQAWGNAIQGLGNIASKTITDYNDPKLKMEKMALAQAEEDRKNEVRLGKLMKRQEASTSTRVVDGAPVIASVDPRDMVSRQTSAQTPELSSRVPSTSFGKPFDVSNGGMARVGTTSPSLVSTTTSKGLYEDENGLFNYGKAYQDLINGGASPASAARVLESGQKTNTALSAYAAQAKSFATARTDMFGNAANTILKALEASPTLTVQAGIQQMLPMLRRQLPAAEYASLQQQVLGMPEAEARQALMGLVDAMDAQHETKTLGRDQTLVTLTGRTVAEGPTTPPAATSAAMQTLAIAQADFDDGIRDGSIPAGTKFTDWSRTTPAVPSLNEVQLALDVANGRPGAKEAWDIYQKANMSKAAAGATAPPGADFSAALPADSMSQDLLSQAGLSFNAFMVLTGRGGQLARDQATRNRANAEVNAWARRSGRDVSTFQSQYTGYNKALELNVQRRNNTLTAESEVIATLENLDAAAKEAGLSDVRMLNEFNLWLKGEGNSPDAATYAFHLNQLRNDLAQYNAASQGRAGASMLKADMDDAERVFKQGVGSGSLAGIKTAIKRSIERQGINLEGAVNRTRHDVWKLFGLGDKFVPSNVVITPDGKRQTFPTDAQAEKFRQAIVTQTSGKG